MRLLPGVTMPSFADPSIGSEAVAPDVGCTKSFEVKLVDGLVLLKA